MALDNRSPEAGAAVPKKRSTAAATPHPSVKVRIKHGKIIFKIAKYTIFAALILNMFLFLRGAPLNEALDSLGWLLLLATFEYESRTLDEAYANLWERYGVLAAQAIGYCMALYVTITYVRTEDWEDVFNSSCWLLVCASIAYDIHAPGEYGGIEWRVRNGVKIALYLALLAVAVMWGIEQDWLSCYDAFLWIFCFAFVEMNIFEFEESEEEATASA